mgnify:CR=1 FL=1
MCNSVVRGQWRELKKSKDDSIFEIQIAFSTSNAPPTSVNATTLLCNKQILRATNALHRHWHQTGVWDHCDECSRSWNCTRSGLCTAGCQVGVLCRSSALWALVDVVVLCIRSRRSASLCWKHDGALHVRSCVDQCYWSISLSAVVRHRRDSGIAVLSAEATSLHGDE